MRDYQTPGRSPVYASNGMCATSHPLAAKVAVQMLEAGGNAVDAAIAGAVLLGLCEPQMTGIGGDCFVLLTPPGEDRVVALNGSGRAPAALQAETIRAKGNTRMDPRSVDTVTMPGAVDAFCRLSADWGKMGLKAQLAPAIHYAEAGVPVAPRVAVDWAAHIGNLQGTARDDFSLSGKAPTAGQIFRAPKQAQALRQIAADGRDGFYDGAVAADLVASLQAAGGVHTLDDLAAVACDYVEPISGGYGGLELVEHPPNGQGAAAILLLNILKNFDIAAMDPWGATRAHIEAEASKLAYDARNRFVADADHMTRLDHLLSQDTADRLAALIDPNHAMAQVPAAVEQVHKETIYITVVDRDRMAVSLIYSIFDDFGSGIGSDTYGVLFHNRGAGFNLTPGHANEAAGGKRPLHTIIPAMLRKEGKLHMPFGVMGGQYQATGHARFVTNVTDFGLDPQAAIDGPRCFPDTGELVVERSYPAATLQALADKGHKVVFSDAAARAPVAALGGAQAIHLRDDGVLVGGSDPRKDGCALGY